MAGRETIHDRASGLWIIHNPVAGRRKRNHLRQVIERLRADGHALEERESARPGHTAQLAAEARRAGAGIVIAAGGDGTLSEVVDGLLTGARAGAPLPRVAVLPLGTANVVATDLAISKKSTTFAAMIAEGSVLRIWPVRAGKRWFVAMAGAGFDAHVVSHTDPVSKRRFSKAAYVWRAMLVWRRGWRWRYRVTVDGAAYDCASVIVANGPRYGGRFVLAPEARLDQKGVHVLLFGQGGRLSLLKYAVALLTGHLPRLGDVRTVPGRRVEIAGRAGEPLQGDGDIIGELPVTINVGDRAIDFIVPARTG